jgi:hypothetical protein
VDEQRPGQHRLRYLVTLGHHRASRERQPIVSTGGLDECPAYVHREAPKQRRSMVFATRKHDPRRQRWIEAVGEPAPPLLDRGHPEGRHVEEFRQPDADGRRLFERLLDVIGIEHPHVAPPAFCAPLLLPVLLLSPAPRGREHESGRGHVDPEWVSGAGLVVVRRFPGRVLARPHLPDAQAIWHEGGGSGRLDYAVIARQPNTCPASHLHALDLIVLMSDEPADKSRKVGLRRPLVGPTLQIGSVSQVRRTNSLCHVSRSSLAKPSTAAAIC